MQAIGCFLMHLPQIYEVSVVSNCLQFQNHRSLHFFDPHRFIPITGMTVFLKSKSKFLLAEEMAGPKALVFLVCVALFSCIDGRYANKEPVKVSFYYETLCGGCKLMMSDQIYPTYQELSSIMELELVPYGNARIVDGEVACQHGKIECLGNAIQTCALNIYEFRKAFDFIFCMEENIRLPNETAPECARANGLNFDKISECVKGEEGQRLIKEMADKTNNLQPKHEYVPWITINGVHTEKIQDDATENLRQLICDTYQGPKPLVCLKKPSIYWANRLPEPCIKRSYAPTPVKIGFYYETLCPACKDVMTDELYPTYKELSDIMEVELVPYGNAHVEEGKVICQHGEKECLGNIIQGCALHLYKFEKAFDFIACIEAVNILPNESAPECAKKNGLDYKEMTECMTSNEGKELQTQLGKKTDSLQPEHGYVPWITVNGVHTEKLQDSAMKNMKKLVCEIYEGLKPKACSDQNKYSVSTTNGPSPVKIGFFYETLCPGCRMVMKNQIYPTYKVLSDIMDVELVPYGNARKAGDKIMCQHGEEECIGNTIQACALNMYDFKKSFEFIHCMEDTDEMPEESAPECAKSNGLDYDRIKACVKSDLGKELLKKMGAETDSLEPRHKYVPWITVDGVHTNATQYAAMANLKKVVCDAYKGPLPEACLQKNDLVNKTAAPVKIVIYYESQSLHSMGLITFQLHRAYWSLSSIMDVELVPFGKTYKTKNDTWVCHHGPSECYGNTVQSCALSMYNFSVALDFVCCMERDFQLPNVSAPQCAKRSKVDHQRIVECATGQEGDRLQQTMAGKSERFKLMTSILPFVTVNGEHDRILQKLAQTNLRKLVCDLYAGTKPEACTHEDPFLT